MNTVKTTGINKTLQKFNRLNSIVIAPNTTNLRDL